MALYILPRFRSLIIGLDHFFFTFSFVGGSKWRVGVMILFPFLMAVPSSYLFIVLLYRFKLFLSFIYLHWFISYVFGSISLVLNLKKLGESSLFRFSTREFFLVRYMCSSIFQNCRNILVSFTVFYFSIFLFIAIWVLNVVTNSITLLGWPCEVSPFPLISLSFLVPF